MTFAAAANKIPLLDTKNIDMEENGVGRNGTIWPSQGHTDPASQGRWLHGDLKNVALPYVYPLYAKFIELGGLQ